MNYSYVKFAERLNEANTKLLEQVHSLARIEKAYNASGRKGGVFYAPLAANISLLRENRSKTWSYANGDKLGLACLCIDSAGHFTNEVYRFCKPRDRQNTFAIMGRGREVILSVSRPSRNNRRHVVLFTLAVYFKGLLSERIVVKRVKSRDAITWKLRSDGIRNEPLDALVYAAGALVQPETSRCTSRGGRVGRTQLRCRS